MKDYLRERLRGLFEFSTRSTGRHYQHGYRTLAKLGLQQRALVVPFVLTSAASIVFEVGSIGLLGLAATILLGAGPLNFSDLGGVASYFPESITNWLLASTRGEIFLLLVFFAIAAQLARSSLTFLVNVISIRLQRKTSQTLQELITDKLFKMSYENVIKYPVGSLNEKIRLGDQATRLISVGAMAILAIAMLVVYVFLMFQVSEVMAIVAVVVVSLLSLFITRIVKLIRTYGDEFTKAMVKVGELTIDYLNAPRLMRIIGNSNNAKKVINTERHNYLIVREKSSIVHSALTPTIEACTIVGAGIFLIAGYYLSGESAQGVIPKIMIFLLILNRMMPQVHILNKTRLVFASLHKSLEMIGILLITPDVTMTKRGALHNQPFENEICFTEVDFCYSGSHTRVLSGLNLQIKKGQGLAIVGPSGSGKSTLVDLIVGLLEPSSGEILIDGVRVQDINQEKWRLNIGVVDQEAFLLSRSVKDNIVFGRPGFSDDDIKRAAHKAHAHEFIANLDSGYDTLVGDRGQFLSGGQCQRVAIARALLADPEILILDEATSALDTESEQLIRQTIAELGSNRTIIMIAHRLSTLINIDNILVLGEGRVIEFGSRADLMTPGTHYYEMWERQRVESE